MTLNKFSIYCLALFFPSLLLVFVIWFNFFVYDSWNKLNLLSVKGILTQGFVVEKHQSPSLKSPSNFYISYRFEIFDQNNNKSKYLARRIVDENTFNKLYPKSNIDILYLKSNPQTSDIENNRVIDTLIIICIILDIIILVAVIFFFKIKA